MKYQFETDDNGPQQAAIELRASETGQTSEVVFAGQVNFWLNQLVSEDEQRTSDMLKEAVKALPTADQDDIKAYIIAKIESKTA